jgi:hypothetical protein
MNGIIPEVDDPLEPEKEQGNATQQGNAVSKDEVTYGELFKVLSKNNPVHEVDEIDPSFTFQDFKSGIEKEAQDKIVRPSDLGDAALFYGIDSTEGFVNQYIKNISKSGESLPLETKPKETKPREINVKKEVNRLSNTINEQILNFTDGQSREERLDRLSRFEFNKSEYPTQAVNALKASESLTPKMSELRKKALGIIESAKREIQGHKEEPKIRDLSASEQARWNKNRTKDVNKYFAEIDPRVKNKYDKAKRNWDKGKHNELHGDIESMWTIYRDGEPIEPAKETVYSPKIGTDLGKYLNNALNNLIVKDKGKGKKERMLPKIGIDPDRLITVLKGESDATKDDLNKLRTVLTLYQEEQKDGLPEYVALSNLIEGKPAAYNPSPVEQAEWEEEPEPEPEVETEEEPKEEGEPKMEEPKKETEELKKETEEPDIDEKLDEMDEKFKGEKDSEQIKADFIANKRESKAPESPVVDEIEDFKNKDKLEDMEKDLQETIENLADWYREHGYPDVYMMLIDRLETGDYESVEAGVRESLKDTEVGEGDMDSELSPEDYQKLRELTEDVVYSIDKFTETLIEALEESGSGGKEPPPPDDSKEPKKEEPKKEEPKKKKLFNEETLYKIGAGIFDILGQVGMGANLSPSARQVASKTGPTAIIADMLRSKAKNPSHLRIAKMISQRIGEYQREAIKGGPDSPIYKHIHDIERNLTTLQRRLETLVEEYGMDISEDYIDAIMKNLVDAWGDEYTIRPNKRPTQPSVPKKGAKR